MTAGAVLSNGCSISFTCNAVSNNELQNMQNFLDGVV